jgi:FhuF 2Fe-2S C-terminal domain
VTRLTLESTGGPSTHTSLLGSSLAEVAGLISWCSYRLGPLPEELADPSAALSGGWLRCSDALDDGGFFAAWQRSLADRMAQGYGVVPPVTPAGYVMGWYCGMFGFLGGMLFHRARRVPSLAPENLAFRVDPVSCRPAEVAVLDGAFGCLPSDPAGDVPGTTVLPDDGALAAMLRAEVAAHGERFVAAYRGAARFGSHTLWGAVTDALDRGVWHLAHLRGEDAAGAADAALVLPAPALAPFTSGSTIRGLRGPSGRLHWTRTRQSCCFHYKLPGVQGPCATCPRLTVDQRLRRLDQVVSP